METQKSVKSAKSKQQRRQSDIKWSRFSVFIVNFGQISLIVLAFTSLILSKWRPFGIIFPVYI